MRRYSPVTPFAESAPRWRGTRVYMLNPQSACTQPVSDVRNLLFHVLLWRTGCGTQSSVFLCEDLPGGSNSDSHSSKGYLRFLTKERCQTLTGSVRKFRHNFPGFIQRRGPPGPELNSGKRPRSSSDQIAVGPRVIPPPL